eukprot:TRINITY_DN8805_c0_g1_i4.p1 TRINITY_DN8805_c0_g1~~TRINITY_DN8805_c0_g1_i4.p1  ORF type:complete len:116 (+),score=16.34 TRINITY_DN8805_c0_g1_i4:615-962(+)
MNSYKNQKNSDVPHGELESESLPNTVNQSERLVRRQNRHALTSDVDLVGVPQETLQEFQGAFMYFCHPDGNASEEIEMEQLTEVGLDNLLQNLGCPIACLRLFSPLTPHKHSPEI